MQLSTILWDNCGPQPTAPTHLPWPAKKSFLPAGHSWQHSCPLQNTWHSNAEQFSTYVGTAKKEKERAISQCQPKFQLVSTYHLATLIVPLEVFGATISKNNFEQINLILAQCDLRLLGLFSTL